MPTEKSTPEPERPDASAPEPDRSETPVEDAETVGRPPGAKPPEAGAEETETFELPAPPAAPEAAAPPSAPAPPPPAASPPPVAAAEPPRRRPAALAIAAVAAAAVAGGALGAAVTATLTSEGAATTTVVESPADASATPAASPGENLSVSEVYRAVADGVVEIAVTGGSGDVSPFGQDEPPTRGQGSGFVYDDQGRVVTNHHVVDGATSIEVRLADGSTYDARLVGSDASTDLALLEIDAPVDALHPLALGDSEALEVGEEVVAIGSPFGLAETVTSGIVSALDRRITAPNGFAIPDAIQTDAAINRGNSGGPLLNRRAEVVGVNSQIESDSGGNVGIGFAVPSSTVEDVVSQLLESGSVEHAFLGVSVETVPEDAAADLGGAAGAAVAQVREGSPAAESELGAATGSDVVDGVAYPTGGDVITAVDGEAIATADELQNAIAARRPGDTVSLTVVRAGQTRTVDVTLATRPS